MMKRGSIIRAQLILAIAGAVAVLYACGATDDPESDASFGGGSQQSPSSRSTGTAVFPGMLPEPAPDPIYNSSRLHEVKLTIDPNDWISLQDNYRSNQYYTANVTIDGETVRQVGVRVRGEGSRLAKKPPLKLDINKYVSSQTFHGHKSIIVNADNQDPSLLKEPMSFLVFNAMGIPAPFLSFARLYVNNKYIGLYTLVEPIDKPFLKARLGDDEGNLFDYEWAFRWDFDWLGDDPARYIPSPFQPQTNETSLDPSGLIAFFNTIAGSDDETFVADITKLINPNQFLTHVAVENAVAELDGIVGYYAANNFYLYQYHKRDYFVFLPWDKDSTFEKEDWPLFYNMDQNLLTKRLTADSSLRDVYVQAVRKAVTSYVNDRWLLPRLESAYSLIHTAVLEDPNKPQTNDTFELTVNKLRGIIRGREENVLSQID